MKGPLLFFIASFFYSGATLAGRTGVYLAKREATANIADRYFSASIYKSKAGAALTKFPSSIPQIRYSLLLKKRAFLDKVTRASAKNLKSEPNRAPAGEFENEQEPAETGPPTATQVEETSPAAAQAAVAPEAKPEPKLIIALPPPLYESSKPAPAVQPIRAPIATLPAPIHGAPKSAPTPPLVQPRASQAKAFSSLEASPTLYYSAFKGYLPSNETHATILSKLNAGLSLAWHQYWNHRFGTSFRIGLKQEKYASNPSFSSEVRGSSQTLTNLGAALRWNLSQRFWVAAELGYSQELYYRGFYSGPGVELEAVNVPKLMITAGMRVLQALPLYLDTKLSGIITSSVSAPSYFAESGSGYRAEVEIGQQFRLLDAAASVFYESREQNSSLVDITRNDTGLSLFFRWRLSKP